MRITNISCTQFAGVRDRSVALTDGINVVYGKNESGKSTLVNLISRTLFQDARLDRRSDKDFIDSFFPSAKKGTSFSADFADGKIVFETEAGTFTLAKEWGSDARAVLSTPDGVVRDSATITAILREALTYGEGVYADMLFSSQRNTDAVLQTILDASKKTAAKAEIIDAVSQAFAESDGVSAEAIEHAIQAKIDEIEGKHWDADREAPVRKSGRWANGLGEILKAYYALEDARAVLDEISRLERESDRASANYSMMDAAARAAEEAYSRFSSFAGRLEAQTERKKVISRLEVDLAKVAEVLSEWPALSENLEKVKKLNEELVSRKALDLYDAAKVLHDAIRELEEKVAAIVCPEVEEITAVKTAQKDIASLENKLCGMNLTATIKMLGGNQVVIKSLRTGETIEAADVASITEAVSVIVPGVMEMVLSPADINVDDIEQKLEALRLEVQNIFRKYSVCSLEELEALAREYANIQNEIKAKILSLSSTLGEVTFESVKEAAESITAMPRAKEMILADVCAICGTSDISSYIVSNERTLEMYEAEYGSLAELRKKAVDLQNELDTANKSIASTDDIPAEFASIADPEGHLQSLQSDLKFKQQMREDALREKTATASRLESFKENITGDPVAEFEKAEQALEQQKALLARWKHIAKVFMEQKGNIADNPLVDLATNFARYLDLISGSKVVSEFPEADKLSMHIYSSDRLIDYSKLSEGTKETVSLAFRLAVIDHLFPEGGGVAVLDDPFANMDAERTAQSIEIIKDFAARHQVIFLTCKEEYLDMLQGNKIRL